MEINTISLGAIALKNETARQYGVVKGTITNHGAPTTIFVIQGTDTVGAAVAEPDGNFCVDGISTGTYQVLAMPDIAYHGKEIARVDVREGQSTDLGEIHLDPAV